ncbi:MAG: ABC transporter permease [Carbonactinosporaceae bacterium]
MSVRESERAGRASRVQVYTPYRRGLPPLRGYLSHVWERRQFAYEMAWTQLRAQHFNTVLGQLWLLLNPLLLTFVYFTLVSIIGRRVAGPDTLAHIMAGLFAFYFFREAVTAGANSVTKGGRLILNTAFPKAVLPLSAVLVSLFRFVPTLLIYTVVHIATGLSFSLAMLWTIPTFVILAVFTTGCTLLVSTLNVYFRDTRNFLPYVLRIWLYMSPILYFADQVPENLRPYTNLNPMFPILETWSEALVHGRGPDVMAIVVGVAWAVFALVTGTYVFLSREREFAVRI